VTEAAIVVEGVSKRFRWHGDRRDSFKERVFRGKPQQVKEFWALRDVSLEIPKGSTFGLVGHNGSGKSTLLKLLAGIHRPTTGSILTLGRMSALLELGAGFHPELSGRENIYLNGAILGLTRKEIDAAVDSIVDFSGIREFIDVPVKVYSSGMYVRLGFAIAVTVDPEVLIVDEIVAVGDEEFQRKCFDHLHELHKRGTTIVIVSHALSIIENLCDQAVWLDHGRVKTIGEARSVVRGYLEAVNEDEAAHLADDHDAPAEVGAPARRGTGEVRVTNLEYLDAGGEPTQVLIAGDPVTFRMHYDAKEDIVDPVFGLGFLHESGVNVAGPNSARTGGFEVLRRGSGHVDFHVPALPFQPGSFEVTTAVVHKGHVYDYAERAFSLKVRGGGTDEPGLVRLPGSWTLSDRTSTAASPQEGDHVHG
jgi:ABC-2 type transport system ATP-binding protein/lipopolysaccharide transport system ATP-binding protein